MSSMAYDKINEKEKNECHFGYWIVFSKFKILNGMKFDQGVGVSENFLGTRYPAVPNF